MYKKMELPEIHETLLKLAKSVDAICAKHNIPFIMVGGTMLGAIRHKNFIPWDDDMDFAVPYEHFFILSNILKHELPSEYKCLTYEDNDHVRSFFFKVVDTRTRIDDPTFTGSLEEKPYLGIDVFPLVCCNEHDGIMTAKKVYRLWRTNRIVFTMPANGKRWQVRLKKLLQLLYPFPPSFVNDKIRVEIEKLVPGNKYVNIVSPQFWNKVWPKELFQELVRYPFASTSFWGVKDAHAYLTQCYGNYMQLPPIEKRRVHGNNSYQVVQ